MHQWPLQTDEAYLLDHNSRNGRDKVWSNNQVGDGTNWLGLQLMLIRDELRGQNVKHLTWTEYISKHCDIDLETGLSRSSAHENVWQNTVRNATQALVWRL